METPWNVLVGEYAQNDPAFANLLAQVGQAPGFDIGARRLDELETEDRFSIGQQGSAKDQLLAELMAKHAVLVRRTTPTRAREYPIGFVSDGPIDPGVQVAVISRPQIPFRGERVVVPSDIAGDFEIADLRVGKDSQFVSPNAVPARTFTEQGVGVRMIFDTAQISQDIVLSVRNIGGAPKVFRAAIIGTALER